MAGLRRCSGRLAGGLRRSGPRCVSGLLHRTEHYYIEQNWADIRPKRLRERLAAGRGLMGKPCGLGVGWSLVTGRFR